jgi:hypothetical protein
LLTSWPTPPQPASGLCGVTNGLPPPAGDSCCCSVHAAANTPAAALKGTGSRPPTSACLPARPPACRLPARLPACTHANLPLSLPAATTLPPWWVTKCGSAAAAIPRAWWAAS